MPTAFCALDQAYGSWDNDKIVNGRKVNGQFVQSSGQPTQQQQPQQSQQPPKPDPEQKKSQENINVDFDKGNDIRSFCPNCKNCLNKNDEFQQKVIDQATWPRMRWIPQIPQSYVPFDPYNRYWTNVAPINGREDFGNPYSYEPRRNDTEILLKITIFIVSVLFIILLVDVLYKNKLSVKVDKE